MADKEEISRSPTTNPLDECIDQYQKCCLDVKIRNGHGYIPTGAARSAVGENARKKKTGRDSFAGSQRSSSYERHEGSSPGPAFDRRFHELFEKILEQRFDLDRQARQVDA